MRAATGGGASIQPTRKPVAANCLETASSEIT
jgi:hypothetical protein